MNYLFTSERLGFRAWTDNDIDVMYEKVNSDPEVMRFFPSTYNRVQTAAFVKRMQDAQEKQGYCFFATELLDTREFVGFVGLNHILEDTPYAPFTEIGWRLAKQFWGKGFATEGARAAIDYGFNTLNLPEIYSQATEINIPSINVMKKIGMSYVQGFEHPKLAEYKSLVNCVLYRIKNGSKQ